MLSHILCSHILRCYVPHKGMEIKCSKLRDNKKPALVGYSSPLLPSPSASRSCFPCFSPQGRNQSRVLLSSGQVPAWSPPRPWEDAIQDQTLTKRSRWEGYNSSTACCPDWATHGEWWRLLSVQTLVFFNWKKFTLLCAMPTCSVPCLELSCPSPMGRFRSMCHNNIFVHRTSQQRTKEGYINRRSLQGLKIRSWGRRSWEQSNPPPEICSITCPWHTH